MRIAKATIQKYLRGVRPSRRAGQSWSTFVHHQAPGLGACDVLPVTDLLFRSIPAFLVMELPTRTIVPVGVTRHPTGAWVTRAPA
jgi:putative transposase